MPGRVGFLYIAQPHQVLHSISTAVELARARPDLEVEVLATSRQTFEVAMDVTVRLGSTIGGRMLGPAPLRALAHDGGPPPKLPILAANLVLFSHFDVLVTPERTTAALRRMGVSRPALVNTRHGAGDRAATYEPRLRAFDLVFAAGPKERERLVSRGLAAPEACVIVGYPKFDVVDRIAAPPPQLFAQDRPTVLYNPHFDLRVSSWPRWGLRVLEAFAAQDRYNLIFAPHLRLFEHATPGQLAALAPFRDHPAIHVDLGGPAAIDMTYTRMADLYVGDASSQVYEFLRTPRPCVFLDPGEVRWEGDDAWRHWRLGPIAHSADGLMAAIDAAFSTHAAYRAAQVEAFRQSCDLQPGDASSSRRAAQAIAALADARAARPRAAPRSWAPASAAHQNEFGLSGH